MLRLVPASLVALFTISAFMVASLAISTRAAANTLDWSAVDLVDIHGARLDPSSFEGRVVLVVNTASRCAFTPQYDGLESLWDRYRDRGLVILGVPSNDFGNQEPGSNAEIAQFCESTFGVSFPMTGKSSVVGPNAHPVFAWARSVGGRKAVPGWNFHKILIGRNGQLAASFPSFENPQSRAVTAAVEAALAAAPAI